MADWRAWMPDKKQPAYGSTNTLPEGPVHYGPFGGRYTPGNRPGKSMGASLAEPFREINRAVTDALGVPNNWIPSGWGPATGLTPSGGEWMGRGYRERIFGPPRDQSQVPSSQQGVMSAPTPPSPGLVGQPQTPQQPAPPLTPGSLLGAATPNAMAIGSDPQVQNLTNAIGQLDTLNRGIANRGPLSPMKLPAGQLDNTNARSLYDQTGYMPNRTVGGNYGLTPQVTPQGPKPVGLGLAPSTQAGFGQQMRAQNPNAQNFGGALPTMIAGPNGPMPGFLSEPMRDMTQKPQFPANEYTTTASGALTPKSQSYGIGSLTMDQRAAQDTARKTYLTGRDAVVDARKARVAEREIGKGKARTDALRQRRGQLSFEERLAAAAPESYQMRRAQEAVVGSRRDIANRELDNREAALRQQASEGRLNRENRIEAERIRAGLPPASSNPEQAVTNPTANILNQVNPTVDSQIAAIESTNPEAAQALRDMQARLRQRMLGGAYPILNPFWNR